MRSLFDGESANCVLVGNTISRSKYFDRGLNGEE
jgi:hypothetical protein